MNARWEKALYIIIVFISMMNMAQSDETSLPLPAHHVENGFQNDPYIDTSSEVSFSFYLRRFWHSIFLHDVPENHYLPEAEALNLRASLIGDKITWLGHASFLIQLNDQTILTDPFLTDFASPSTLGGPQRMLPPGISIENLPPIDVIIISHNHYDHLDIETLKALPNKPDIQVLVPLGVKSLILEQGFTQVHQLDWNQNINIHPLKITSVPCVHNSGRNLDDTNQTLWTSWVINSPQQKILFVGDSAYSDIIYPNIGKEYGPFDYAIIPIGTYAPRDRMKTHHMDPKESVQSGRDVKAKIIIASHWGTINLSDEPPWEPPVLFKQSGLDQGLSEQDLWVMKTGETRSLKLLTSE